MRSWWVPPARWDAIYRFACAQPKSNLIKSKKKGDGLFNEIPEAMKRRMKELEEIDEKDRKDGSERLKRLRQIPKETGKFLALYAANLRNEGDWIEIGTSAGYSTMWLALAAKEAGKRIKTFEILEEKYQLAKETIDVAGIEQYVEIIHGDFIKVSDIIEKVAFCFLDCEKHLYDQCFDIVSEKMVSGSVLVADNAINHYESLKNMIDKAETDFRFDCLTVPIGKGEFICRRK